MLEQKGKELQLAIVRAEGMESVQGNNLFLTSGAISSDSKNGVDRRGKLGLSYILTSVPRAHPLLHR